MQQDRLLRFPEVRKSTGLSRQTVWRMERAGEFPARRQLSPRAVGWSESEISRWLQQREKVQ